MLTKECTCGKIMQLDVLKSGGGHYLGYLCWNCGPYMRISGYYPKSANAEMMLDLIRTSIKTNDWIALTKYASLILKDAPEHVIEEVILSLPNGRQPCK